MTTQKHEPISIDTHSRNNRLLETLLKMGLVVIPMYTDQETMDIDHFIVSSGMPSHIKVQGQDQG